MRHDSRKRPATPWIPLAIGGGAFVALVLWCAIGAALYSRHWPPPAPNQPAPAAAAQEKPAAKLWTRDEFRRRIYLLPPDQVLEMVGRPDSTQEVGDMVLWYYRHKTYDPVTGKADWQAQVVFINGMADHVNY